MSKLLAAIVLTMISVLPASAGASNGGTSTCEYSENVVESTFPKAEPIQIAQTRETCFKAGERTDGMNKICYYQCLSGQVAITISAVSLCPLSIRR